jgi:hypothetical protein
LLGALENAKQKGSGIEHNAVRYTRFFLQALDEQFMNLMY